jgi:3D (Asp-Asp-Asp) domain-containing protein
VRWLLLLAACSADPVGMNGEPLPADHADMAAADLAAADLAAADLAAADLAAADLAAADLAAADLAAADHASTADLMRPAPGTLVGSVQLTYYWVTQQSDYTGADDTALCDVSANVIAMVPLAFANALKLEGTGKLTDGRLLNIGGSCACPSGMTSCYIVLDQSKYPWGVGVQSRPLVPFRSIAVDKSFIPYGTHVYVPEFDGVQMPSSYGFLHDGCFEADDTGGGIVGAHIDFFAAEKSNYRTLDGTLKLNNVTVYEGLRCP